MTLVVFGGAVVGWICLAVPNAFALQLVLRKMRGEAPHYWNAFFTTAISGLAVQIAGLLLSLAWGTAASLWVFLSCQRFCTPSCFVSGLGVKYLLANPWLSFLHNSYLQSLF